MIKKVSELIIHKMEIDTVYENANHDPAWSESFRYAKKDISGLWLSNDLETWKAVSKNFN